MKQIQGVWLPDGDKHFARMMRKEPARLYRGAEVGVYQYFKIAKAMEFVTSRKLAIDIGGHIGFWSMWLAEEFDSVHAFEPASEHAECFSRNLAGKNVALHRCALGSSDGVAGLSVNAENSGKSCMSKGEDIQVRTLDSFSFQDVGLIKIDVEGYEPEVLEGAADTIKRCKPLVVFEDNGQHERYGFEDPHAVAKRLGMKQVCLMGADWIYQA